jgi:hypothetical protein
MKRSALCNHRDARMKHLEAKMETSSRIAIVADDACFMLLKEIAELIAKAKFLGLPDSVFLLNMAHLDLQTKIHNIDDAEMHAFSNAVRSLIECG